MEHKVSLGEVRMGLIMKALNNHEKFKNSYFWGSPQYANKRREMERDNNFTVEFNYKGNEYKYESSLRVSCQNVYYTGYFYLNDERKDVRLFKKLLKEG